MYCFICKCVAYTNLLSFKMSGKTWTKAICRNPPAVNGKIQADFWSISTPCVANATVAPTMPPMAVNS